MAFGSNNLTPPAKLFQPELDEETLKAITASAAPVPQDKTATK